MLLTGLKIFVSSANFSTQLPNSLCRSLINIKNKTGPSTESPTPAELHSKLVMLKKSHPNTLFDVYQKAKLQSRYTLVLVCRRPSASGANTGEGLCRTPWLDCVNCVHVRLIVVDVCSNRFQEGQQVG